MSTEWIKWTKGLVRRPKVLAIAARLGISRRETAAALMEVWEWFDGLTEDGVAESVSVSMIDAVVDLPGFGEAMESVGWLENNSGESAGVTVPKFELHNGKSAKRRANSNRRVAQFREAKRNREFEETPPDPDLGRTDSPPAEVPANSELSECNAPSVTEALPIALPQQQQEEELKIRTTTTRKKPPNRSLARFVVVVSSLGVCRAREALDKALDGGLAPADVEARIDAFRELADDERRPGVLYNWLALPGSFRPPDRRKWTPKIRELKASADENRRARLIQHGKAVGWTYQAIQAAVEKFEEECLERYRESEEERCKTA